MKESLQKIRRFVTDHPLLYAVAVYVLVTLAQIPISALRILFPALRNEPASAAFNLFVSVAPTSLAALHLTRRLGKPFSIGLGKRNLRKGFVLALTKLAILAAVALPNIITHVPEATDPSTILSILFISLTAGIGEELLFRGLILNNAYRCLHDKPHGIAIALGIASGIFGCAHFLNAVSVGMNLLVLLQVLASAAMGLLYGAVYLRSRNLWGVITMHTLWDFYSLIYTPNTSNTGALAANLTIGFSAQILLLEGFIILACVAFALYLLRPGKRGEALALWSDEAAA